MSPASHPSPSRPGPRSVHAKTRTRGNARSHGLTATVLTLPDEDRAEYDARLERLCAALDPRDEAQRLLVDRIALCSWRLDRAARQEAATLTARVRRARQELARARVTRVLELGRRLVEDPVARCNADHNDRDDPKIVAWRLDEPLLLVMELTETLQGCDWLLDRWREISDVLDTEGFLHYDNKFKLIRLLGKRPETLLDDRTVGDLVLACRALHPENWTIEREAVMTCFGTENRPMYEKRTALLEERMPTDLATALNTLRAAIDDERARLDTLRAEREELWEVEQAEAEAVATFDASHEGVLRRRYEGEHAREVHRCLATLKKLQADESAPAARRPAATLPPEREPEPKPEPSAGRESVSRNESRRGDLGHAMPPRAHFDPTPARPDPDRPEPEIIH